MIKRLTFIVNITTLTIVFAIICLGFSYQAEGAGGAGESSLDSVSPPLQPLNLTLRSALAAAVDNNPDVLLYKERIEAARGQMQTQLGAMLPSAFSMRESMRRKVS
jgi:hypothetical protein